MLASVVRTFLIDEGSIRDTRITFTSGNIALLNDLIQICRKLSYTCCKIRKTWTAYEFSISSRSLEQIYIDIMKIGPLPIINKQKRLDFAFGLINSGVKDSSNIEEQIISLLSKGFLTNIDLAHKLSFSARTIWSHLKILEKQDKIKARKISGMHGAYIYELL